MVENCSFETSEVAMLETAKGTGQVFLSCTTECVDVAVPILFSGQPHATVRPSQ